MSIYNIYHCLETLDPDIAAGLVSCINEETWVPYSPLPGWCCLRSNISRNTKLVTQDLILKSYLIIYHCADAILSLQCVEFRSRILNNDMLLEDNFSSSIILEVLDVALAPAPLSKGEPVFVALILLVQG